MNESIMLSNPILLIGFSLTYLLSLLSLLMKMKSPLLPLISLFISISCLIYALLLGAKLKEIAFSILPLFLIMILSYIRQHKSVNELQ